MRNADMPAMPVNPQGGYSLGGKTPNGITKREHYAGLAMQGLLGNEPSIRSMAAAMPDLDIDQVIAKASAEIADALLAELERAS